VKGFLKKYIDKVFWVSREDSFSVEKLHHKKSKPFSGLKLRFRNELVNQKYHYDNEHWYHNEMVFLIKEPVWIEPQYGIVIKSGRNIFAPSHQFTDLFPSAPRFLKAQLQNENVLEIERAVLFDGALGSNYFHFFSNVLSKLWVLEQYLNLKETPIIIHQKTYNTKYFQYLLNETSLGEYPWVVQHGRQYIKVKELYFSKPMPYELAHWSKTQKLLGVIPQEKEYAKKVFLSRSVKSGRFIENMEEIIPLLKEYEIEVVDTNGWTLQQQMALMQDVSHFIGIHGAGMTNMMLCHNPKLKILEINPANRVSCHYYWMANMFGFSYDVLLGSELPFTNVYPEKGFKVDKDLLSAHLATLMG